MPRAYATIKCSIWDDAAFCGLSAGAQRTYFMLVSQADLSPCGVLALTLRRWSSTCVEKTLDIWLKELVEARFVIVDEDTEEVLVRTFVKYDDGHKHAVRRKAIIASVSATRSPLLRHSIAAELAKLGVETATPEPHESHSTGTEEAVESQRNVVTELFTDRTPQSSLHSREPEPHCPRHPNGTDEPCGPCARRREANEAASRAVESEAAHARAAAAEERRTCLDCDENGFICDSDGHPVSRCDHKGISA